MAASPSTTMTLVSQLLSDYSTAKHPQRRVNQTDFQLSLHITKPNSSRSSLLISTLTTFRHILHPAQLTALLGFFTGRSLTFSRHSNLDYLHIVYTSFSLCLSRPISNMLLRIRGPDGMLRLNVESTDTFQHLAQQVRGNSA